MDWARRLLLPTNLVMCMYTWIKSFSISIQNHMSLACKLGCMSMHGNTLVSCYVLQFLKFYCLQLACSVHNFILLWVHSKLNHLNVHRFGMPHDDSEHCTQTKVSGDEAYRTQERSNPLNLMSSTLDYNIETWSWSNCSRRFITTFLE